MEQSTFNQRVAAEVRAELGRQNLSQADLAGQLGWVQSQLSRRLRGLVAFSTDEIERIAVRLDVPLEQLISEPSADRGAMRLLEQQKRNFPGRGALTSADMTKLASAGEARHMTIRTPRAVVRTGTDS